jgi:hypothetical protein
LIDELVGEPTFAASDLEGVVELAELEGEIVDARGSPNRLAKP